MEVIYFGIFAVIFCIAFEILWTIRKIRKRREEEKDRKAIRKELETIRKLQENKK